MKNAEELADIAKRCERVATIIQNTRDHEDAGNVQVVLNATEELEKYVNSDEIL